MPNKILEIMEIRRILRLYQSGKSKRFIAEYLGLSRNTVNKYLGLFALSGYTYEDLLKRSDQQLNKLFGSKIISTPDNLVELERLFPLIDRELIIKILEEGRYPAAAFRSCSGVINLARKVGNVRVENACKRALDYKQHNYRIVKTILDRLVYSSHRMELKGEPFRKRKNQEMEE